MKKIISFSLWGGNKKYTVGAIKNALLAKIIYPDWICRFYIGLSVPKEISDTLKCFDNTEVIQMESEGDWTSMFWRFLAASDEEVGVFISRDSDSRLSFREKICVDSWLDSDKNFHSIRDHKGHDIPILGGMWGCRNGILNNMKSLVDIYNKGDFWQVDQNFLTSQIYPRVYGDMICHDDFYTNKFPNSVKIPHVKTEETSKEFVGKPFEFNDISCHDGEPWQPASIWK